MGSPAVRSTKSSTDQPLQDGAFHIAAAVPSQMPIQDKHHRKTELSLAALPSLIYSLMRCKYFCAKSRQRVLALRISSLAV